MQLLKEEISEKSSRPEYLRDAQFLIFRHRQFFKMRIAKGIESEIREKKKTDLQEFNKTLYIKIKFNQQRCRQWRTINWQEYSAYF
jgi:hypothetical protein